MEETESLGFLASRIAEKTRGPESVRNLNLQSDGGHSILLTSTHVYRSTLTHTCVHASRSQINQYEKKKQEEKGTRNWRGDLKVGLDPLFPGQFTLFVLFMLQFFFDYFALLHELAC